MPEKIQKIALCMPLCGFVSSEVVINFSRFLYSPRENNSYQLIPFFTLNKSLSVARDLLVKSFLESDCDYLFFVDSDMLLPKNILDKLLAHNKDIVSAMYFCRKRGFPLIKKTVGDQLDNYLDYPENKLIEVGAMGAGCMLIKRKVLEELAKKEKNKPLFKLAQIDREKILGEDIYFCLLARKHGFKVFVDTGLIVGHYGTAIIGEFGKELDALDIRWDSLNA